jgi:type I site-specific restriction endonuclease
MAQALESAEILDAPFAYSSNGDAFLEHDRTAASGTVTREDGSKKAPRYYQHIAINRTVEAIVAYAQPGLDGTDGSAADMQKAFAMTSPLQSFFPWVTPSAASCVELTP